MNRPRLPRSFFCLTSMVAFVSLAAPPSLRGAPLPPEIKLIPRDAGLFVSVRIPELLQDPRLKALRQLLVDNPEALREFEKMNGFKPTDLTRVTLLIPEFGERPGASDPCIILTFSKPYDLEKILRARHGITPEEERKRHPKAKYYILQNDGFLIPINQQTLVIYQSDPYGNGREIMNLLTAFNRQVNEGPLSSALEVVDKHVLVAGCNLRSIKAALPPDYAEILPIISILSSPSALLTLDLEKELKLSLQVDSPDAATAKRVSDVLKALHVLGMEMFPGLEKMAAQSKSLPLAPILTLFRPMFKEARIEMIGKSTVVAFETKDDVTVWSEALATTIKKVRSAAERRRREDALKELSVGIANYYSAIDQLPFPGFSAPKGRGFAGIPNPKPNLSWRVGILPYIEGGKLYEEFRFDEPWDSEHNKKLIPRMPKIFAPVGKSDLPLGHTYLRMFNSPGTIGMAKSFRDITDGTSNTIMIVESNESVPWTKPDELTLDPKKPKAKLLSKNGKLIVAMADGSVREIDLNKISDETLRNAITIADGNILGMDWDK